MMKSLLAVAVMALAGATGVSLAGAHEGCGKDAAAGTRPACCQNDCCKDAEACTKCCGEKGCAKCEKCQKAEAAK